MLVRSKSPSPARSFSLFTLAAAAAAFALPTIACNGSGDGADHADHVEARAHVIRRSSQALTIDTLDNLEGVYSETCQDNPGGAWTLSLGPGGDPTTLSVLRNDVSCVLKVTGIKSGGQSYATSMPFDLTTSFPSTASPFGAPTAFYAVAKVSADSFASDFTLDLVFSDDLGAVTTPVGAFHSTVESSSVTSDAVEAPDYVPGVDGVMVARNAENIVTAVTGAAVLVKTTYAADFFVIDQGTLSASPTFSEVESVYNAGIKRAPSAGTITTIFANDLVAGGNDLTGGLVRTFILHRAVNGVSSYQMIKLTFVP